MVRQYLKCDKKQVQNYYGWSPLYLLGNEIAGVAFDVYENEPEFDHEFSKLKNVILTPHIGNATIEARNEMPNIVADNVILLNQEKMPKFIIN